jgi:2-oxoacid:acceptor oxidoreductase gamma subunit (pyruvate/2-ketoisovalerate family)
MLEIRIHGRGGQGAVIASKVLAAAFFGEGRWAQGFPAFGVERRGAPVAAFVRVDEQPIHLRCEIYEPHFVIVLDPTLPQVVNVAAGLRPGGSILLNSPQEPTAFSFAVACQVATVDASSIAVRHGLGTAAAPIVNTAILGAFARCSGLLTLAAVEAAIGEYVPGDRAANLAAAREAFETARWGAKVP